MRQVDLTEFENHKYQTLVHADFGINELNYVVSSAKRFEKLDFINKTSNGFIFPTIQTNTLER